MLGAIIGDISGSRYEWDNHKSKDFPFFEKYCKPTDDSIMTLAISSAIVEHKGAGTPLADCAVKYMQMFGRHYPDAGYGGHFVQWLQSSDPKPYNSWGNGAAMRVSPCGFAASTLAEALTLSDAVTAVTHNHPEGIKGARATTAAIFLARSGYSIEKIKEHIKAHYYNIDFTLDEIRPDYVFDVSCQGSVPQALEAFFESTGFEDAIRNAISIGGDSDTIAAITGGVAEAYYGLPKNIRNEAMKFLDDTQSKAVECFEAIFGRYGKKTTI